MTKPIATFSEFVSIPELLGNDFEGPSWDSWRVTMKGALGEEINEVERIRFRGLAGRDPPPGRVRELWLAIGRRAGKDSIAAALATYLAVFSDFRRYCRRGERTTVMCLAVDRPQAGIVFGYIRANVWLTEHYFTGAVTGGADQGALDGLRGGAGCRRT